MNTYPKISFNKKEEKVSSKQLEKQMYAEPKFMIAPEASKLPKPFAKVLEKKEQAKMPSS